MSNSEPVTAAIQQFLALLCSDQEALPKHFSQDPSSQKSTQENLSIDSLKRASDITVALSGGADSVALLHAFYQQFCYLELDLKHLKAVYIDHQLSPNSTQWAEHNKLLCQDLGIDYQVIVVDVECVASQENAARQARYAALQKLIKHDQYLVTGHHQDDQAETLLLQLFRGSGPKGLSAMPALTEFSQGFHARPLLSVSKKDILNYCTNHGLDFVQDPSNKDIKHRRNFLRHEIFPLLEREWPQLKSSLARASDLQAAAQEIIEERAAQDFANCFVEGQGILIQKLASLSLARQHSMLRFWFQTLEQSMPSFRVLQQLIAQMVYSEQDAQPSIDLDGGSVKRFDGFLTWLTSDISQQKDDKIKPTNWDGLSDLYLTQSIVVSFAWLKRHYPQLVGKPLIVSQRCGGERFRKVNAEHTTSLKNYLQETKVPAWQRDKVLLIQLDNEVCAIYKEHLKGSAL